jgi:hypothetical protein
MIWNMKPDRIQFGPPIDDGGPWIERPPTLTRSLEFEEVLEAGLFLIYADKLAGESDEIRVTQNLFSRSLSITVKPVSADYLTHAVYEYAGMIDAAIEEVRGTTFDHDGIDDELLDFDDELLDFDDDDLDGDDLDELEN